MKVDRALVVAFGAYLLWRAVHGNARSMSGFIPKMPPNLRPGPPLPAAQPPLFDIAPGIGPSPYES